MSIVIITGAARGIGYETALAFAHAGAKVYAGVRDSNNAGQLKAVIDKEDLTIEILDLDVTQPNTFADFVNRVVEESGAVDVLVNNAGIIRPGAFEDISEADLRQVMETNFFGAMLLSKAVLPQMRKQRSGKIIMMSSLSGIAGLPGDVAYSASKFALEGATEALRHEVSKWGIHVALVEAGQYATSLFEDTTVNQSPLPANYPTDSMYEDLIESQLNKTKDNLRNALDPDSIGELMVKIANSDGSQLRWQADDLAKKIVSDLFAMTDSQRDTYLRQAADIEWWLSAKSSPS